MSLDKDLVMSAFPTIKQRNELFDFWFYDTGSLTADEKEALSPLLQREGAVIVVSPTGEENPIRHYSCASSFLDSEGESVKALVVAGVGSSVVGTAALARNVADAYNIDVAGIVSGYGASDLISEAMGGWFFYGATDAFRHQIRKDFAKLDALYKAYLSSLKPERASSAASGTAMVPTDLGSLLEILQSDKLSLHLLVGHSKGNLLIDYALEKYAKQMEGTNDRYFTKLNIVSLGAVTDFPPQFERVHQFIGEVDWFGGMNSRLDLPHDKVPRAWHHLNTAFPYHVPVKRLLVENVYIG